jgi:hypothetical protein
VIAHLIEKRYHIPIRIAGLSEEDHRKLWDRMQFLASQIKPDEQEYLESIYMLKTPH